MKSNADKLIKDKMGSLDTLSNGIVYGKEDAWEKLQARMERKPVRNIRIQYWVAAAVLLLVVIIAIPVYYHGEKGVAKDNIHETKTNPIPTETITQQTPIVIEQPEKATLHAAASVKKKQTHFIAASKDDEYPIINNIETPVQRTEDETHDNIVKNTAPAPKLIEPMKVVHINELENSSVLQKTTTAAIVNNEPSTDFKKMSTVHITDVVKEEYEVKKIRRENRMTFGRNIFTRPSYNDNYSNSNTEDYYEPHRLLKNIFNTQN